MPKRSILAIALVLALAAPALASEMFPKPPVPSARDRGTTAAKKTQTPASWKNLKGSGKIVKTTKGANATGTTATAGTTAQ